MKHVVSFSGGKDSTCMLLMMLEKKMQVDEIIFCDTGMEFPQMYEHIKKVEQYIGRPITILKEEKGFEYYMFEHEKTKGNNMDHKGYAWPTSQFRWCTRRLKIEIINKYKKALGCECVDYIGIAADELERTKGRQNKEQYPLIDFNISEAEALKYCYEKGFDWGGLYKDFHRVSCWCCPLQPLKCLRTLYHKYPVLWKMLKNMDLKSNNDFRSDYSVRELEHKFKMEDLTNEFPLF